MALKTKIILFVLSGAFLCVVFSSCGNTKVDKTKYGNCTDGITNQNEEGVDCGGYCLPCANCNDGVQNAGETGIDCGGPCTSCSPSCTLTIGTVEYTLFPELFPNGYSDSQNTSGTGYYSPSSSEITIGFSSGALSALRIEFKKGFNPLDSTAIPLNQTMIFKTLDNSTFNISQNSTVKASFYGNINFSYYSRGINSGQLVYISKFADKKVSVRLCHLKANKDTISLNAVVD